MFKRPEYPFIEVSLFLEIRDTRAFYRAALRRMGDDMKVSLRDRIDTLRMDGELDLGACARMLIDPGVSPDGSKITDSVSEVF